MPWNYWDFYGEYVVQIKLAKLCCILSGVVFCLSTLELERPD